MIAQTLQTVKSLNFACKCSLAQCQNSQQAPKFAASVNSWFLSSLIICVGTINGMITIYQYDFTFARVIIRQEHKKHSPSCPFLSIQKPSEMSAEDMMKLLRDRYRLLIVSFCAGNYSHYDYTCTTTTAATTTLYNSCYFETTWVYWIHWEMQRSTVTTH